MYIALFSAVTAAYKIPGEILYSLSILTFVEEHHNLLKYFQEGHVVIAVFLKIINNRFLNIEKVLT